MLQSKQEIATDMAARPHYWADKYTETNVLNDELIRRIDNLTYNVVHLEKMVTRLQNEAVV